MRLTSKIILGFLGTCCLWVSYPGMAARLPTESDIREQGCFHFPQPEARILCDTKALRLSAWNNADLLYIQAILWNDDSMALGKTEKGQQYGDSSTLSLDVDANQKVTPNQDRDYSLDPWPSLHGLFYCIQLSRHSSTDIKDDSSGTGSICYMALANGSRARVDSYVIPLKEIGKRVGEDIRLCFRAQSAVPAFEINSAGDTNRPPQDSCYHIPGNRYHRLQLGNGNTLPQKTIAASWSKGSKSFTRSRAARDSNERWFCSSSIYIDSSFNHAKFNDNTPDMIRQELVDKEFLPKIGIKLKLPSREMAKIRFVYSSLYNSLTLEQNGAPPFVYEPVHEAVDSYVKARSAGHTRKLLMSSLINSHPSPACDDPGMRAIVDSQPWIPISALKLEETGVMTNKAGKEVSRTTSISSVNGISVTNEVADIPKTDEVRKWACYILLDGDLCWQYGIQFKANGSVAFITDSKYDSKDFDPKYKDLIAEVEKDVSDIMKKKGSSGKFGSCHLFWQLKKDKLKERGLDWHSPSEVNPYTSYD